MIRRRILTTVASVILILSAWIVRDLIDPSVHDLSDFDGREVARIETAMWKSYYSRQPLLLYWQLTGLLRRQYHAPFWRAAVGGYHAARAAVVFQRGSNRVEYLRALPDLESFYALIRRGSSVPFDVRKVAAMELDWWITHRERAQHPQSSLESALAALQAGIYQQPDSRFIVHAKERAEAMLLRDARAASGEVSDHDWRRVAEMLNRSWVSLQTTVAK